MSLILSPAPHVRTKNTTQRLMLNVVISLLRMANIIVDNLRPIYPLPDKVRALSTVAIGEVRRTRAPAVLAELVWQKLAHQTVRINDFSAVVTGLLLGLCITPSAPWWMVMIGAFFAIIVVKQLFGGIGDNFLNPALTARAVLLASWPALMTTHCTPFDAVTSATPLMTGEASTMQLLLGDVPGAIGETCKVAILLGFVYLLVTQTIRWEIPVFTVAAAALLSWALGLDPLTTVLSGGLLFGAVYMATDYVTSPFTLKGKIVFGIGLGIITSAIRFWGNMAEGVSFAILLMNLWVPYINDLTHQVPLGYKKPEKKKEAAK